MTRTNICPTCGARPYQPCRSKTGKPTTTHAARANGPRPAPSVAPALRGEWEHERVHADNWTPRKVEPVLGPLCGAESYDTEDAERYVRNATYGMTDDTLDPVIIIRDLLALLWNRPTREAHDQKISELEDEIADLEDKLAKMTVEHDTALSERDDAEAQRDHFRAKFVEADDLLNQHIASCPIATPVAREFATYRLTKELAQSLDRTMEALDSADRILKSINL